MGGASYLFTSNERCPIKYEFKCLELSARARSLSHIQRSKCTMRFMRCRWKCTEWNINGTCAVFTRHLRDQINWTGDWWSIHDWLIRCDASFLHRCAHADQYLRKKTLFKLWNGMRKLSQKKFAEAFDPKSLHSISTSMLAEHLKYYTNCKCSSNETDFFICRFWVWIKFYDRSDWKRRILSCRILGIRNSRW